MDFISLIASLFGAYFVFKALFYLARRQRLLKKYQDVEVVRRIMRKSIWEGMTADMLMDSLGKPSDIDEKLTQRHRTLTYKYHQTGRGRYGTRVTVRDGEVIGYDVK